MQNAFARGCALPKLEKARFLAYTLRHGQFVFSGQASLAVTIDLFSRLVTAHDVSEKVLHTSKPRSCHLCLQASPVVKMVR